MKAILILVAAVLAAAVTIHVATAEDPIKEILGAALISSLIAFFMIWRGVWR